MNLLNIFKRRDKKSIITNIIPKFSSRILDFNGRENIIKKSITDIFMEDNLEDRIGICIGTDHPKIVEVQNIVNGNIEYDYSKTGEVVRAKSDGRIGVIIKINNFTKQVTVLHEINPTLYCTYDDYDMLDKLYASSLSYETVKRGISSQ